MRFFKNKNIYQVSRITGNHDHILGVVFANQDKTTDNIELIEWNFTNIKKSSTTISKDEVLRQVLSGLGSVNQSLGTNYKLSQIYFCPLDPSNDSIYELLISKLIRHFHSGNEFKEI
jgi:hypothetical protein